MDFDGFLLDFLGSKRIFAKDVRNCFGSEVPLVWLSRIFVNWNIHLFLGSQGGGKVVKTTQKPKPTTNGKSYYRYYFSVLFTFQN